MSDDLAAANVNRSYQLAASSIAIFTFLLFFLYPRFASGQVDALRFQATLIVMGVATFSFAFASFYYYAASLGSRIDHPERAKVLASRRSAVAARMRPAVPGSDLDPLHGQASCRRLGVVRALAGVRALRDPLLPARPDCRNRSDRPEFHLTRNVGEAYRHSADRFKTTTFGPADGRERAPCGVNREL